MNRHAKQIIEASINMAGGNIWETESYQEYIRRHTEALVAELEAAEARVARLGSLVLDLEKRLDEHRLGEGVHRCDVDDCAHIRRVIRDDHEVMVADLPDEEA